MMFTIGTMWKTAIPIMKNLLAQLQGYLLAKTLQSIMLVQLMLVGIIGHIFVCLKKMAEIWKNTDCKVYSCITDKHMCRAADTYSSVGQTRASF